jgi:hypothetical protein
MSGGVYVQQTALDTAEALRNNPDIYALPECGIRTLNMRNISTTKVPAICSIAGSSPRILCLYR